MYLDTIGTLEPFSIVISPYAIFQRNLISLTIANSICRTTESVSFFVLF